MIFLDQSGKRWRRIKRSTVTVGLLGVIPVMALIGGSLMYHPAWGALPLVGRSVSAVIAGASNAVSGTIHTNKPKTTKTKTAAVVVRSTTTGTTLGAATSNATPTPQPNTVAGTPTPTATPKSPQSSSPTGGYPPQSKRPIR